MVVIIGMGILSDIQIPAMTNLNYFIFYFSVLCT